MINFLKHLYWRIVPHTHDYDIFYWCRKCGKSKGDIDG